MSPLPVPGRLGEQAVKGAHLGLRVATLAPEQRRARALARQAAARAVPADGRRVAILTPRDWASHVQWEGTIAQALRVRGAHVSFITCGGGLDVCDRANVWEAPPMPCHTCTRYVEGSVDAHGFPRLALRTGWETGDGGDGWPELDGLSLDELGEMEAEGLPLGHLVDVPTKWFLMKAQLGEDPLAPSTMRQFLRSARRIARGLSAALDRLQPEVVLMLNGLFLFEAVCWALCRERGIEVVTYERGLIRDTLVFRRGGAACQLDVSDAWARGKDVPLTDAENAELDAYLADRRVGRRTIDQFWDDPRFDRPQHDAGGRLVTLFTNLTWDSAVIGQSVAFETIQDWVAAAVEAFAKRPEHELIIRIHPAEVKLPGKWTRENMGAFLAERFPALPPNVRVIGPLDPTSSYTLMEASDLGLVFTSTTGLELALNGKPVIVAGQTHYRGKGFTVDVSTPSEFDAALDSALDDPAAFQPDPDIVRRYAHLFFFRAPVATPWVEEHILGLARITIRDLAELAPGADAGLDRICDGIVGRGDFTPPMP